MIWTRHNSLTYWFHQLRTRSFLLIKRRHMWKFAVNKRDREHHNTGVGCFWVYVVHIAELKLANTSLILSRAVKRCWMFCDLFLSFTTLKVQSKLNSQSKNFSFFLENFFQLISPPSKSEQVVLENLMISYWIYNYPRVMEFSCVTSFDW